MNNPLLKIKKYDIGLIMLLAFVVRMIGFAWMDYTNFPEFYRDYYMVSHIAHGTVVLLGPPSMLHGFHFGPFYYYSMVPFFILFNGHPFGLIFTGILVSVLSVYAFFKLLLLWFKSRTVALTGALFIALSVYSIRLTAYVSNPNFLPLFVMWYFYYLTKVLLGSGKNKDYILLGASLGLATQLHATAMIVLPLVTLTAIILQKYRPKLKTAAIFFAGLIFTYIPYLFFEFTHWFINFRRLFVLGTKELDGSHYNSGVDAIWNFFQGTLTPFNTWYGYTNIQPNSLYIIVSVCAVLAIGDLIYKFLKRHPGLGQYKISLIGRNITLAWTFFTCTVLLLFARGVHDHYIIILWPVPLVFLVYAIFWMRARYNIFASLILLVSVVSILQIFSFFQARQVPWSTFWTVYNGQYRDAPFTGISEIGA